MVVGGEYLLSRVVTLFKMSSFQQKNYEICKEIKYSPYSKKKKSNRDCFEEAHTLELLLKRLFKSAVLTMFKGLMETMSK